MRTESWCGYGIRFVDPDMMARVPVEVEVPSKHVDSQTFLMLAISEEGIYEDLANTI